MSAIQSIAVTAAGVSTHPMFAAGMEAAVVFKLMAQGDEVVVDGDSDKLHLLTINREVYRNFAQAFDYQYVLFMNETDDRDGWRFTKKGKVDMEVGPGVLEHVQKILDHRNNKC